MHAVKPHIAIAFACAIGGCAPVATQPGVDTSPADTTSPPTPPPAAAAAQSSSPKGKRAAPAPGEVLSPIMGFKGGGDGWRVELFNTAGYEHRVTLTWDNGAQRGAGVVIYQPTRDGSLERKVLEGRLGVAGNDRTITVQLVEDDCTGGDGITHDHTVIVTVDGMAPLRGCGEIAI